MAITIQGPDGASIDFPEGTSEADMQAAMAQAYPSDTAPSGNAMSGAARALETNLPLVDRAVAAAKSALPQGYGGTGQDYATNLAAEKAKNARFAEQNPWTTAVGGLAAYAPAALLPAGGASLLGRTGAGAATGFGLGGLQGLSNSPDLTNNQETSRDIAQGAIGGAALGAAGVPIAHAVGSGVSALTNALRGGPGPADLAALQTAKKAAYQNVKDMGAAYSPASFKSLVDDIATAAQEQGINSNLHPGAASVISDMQKRVKQGTPISLPELDQIRQIAWRDSAGKMGPDNAGERLFGNQIRNNIDEFIANAGPDQMAGGAGLAAGERAPKQRLVVAGKTSEGDIIYGQPGQTHADLYAPGFSLDDPVIEDLGFAEPGGPFMSRKEAGEFVRNNEPLRAADLRAINKGYEGAYNILDSEKYARPQVPPGPDAAPAEGAPNAAVSPPVASAQEAAEAIQNARDLAQRQFKAQALAKALDKAEIRADTTGSYGNIENATRQRLAVLYEKEPWTPDEFAQLKKMAQGTTLTNALSRASKLSPLGHALPFYADLIGTGLGQATMPGLSSAIGIGAQAGGALARRNAQNKLMATILAGGTAPIQATSSRPVSRPAMAAALAANAGLQAPRSQAPQP